MAPPNIMVPAASPGRHHIQYLNSATSEILNPYQVPFKVLVFKDHQPRFHNTTLQP